MTEIPEHLLKRSRERRAALGLGGSEDVAAGAESKPASAAVAKIEPAGNAASGPAQRSGSVARPTPAKAKPDSAVVAAFKVRNRIPGWAMLALALLPLWAFMYARSVTTQHHEVAGPLGEGAEVFGGCAGCHGASGEGGVGYQFSDGEVLKTFPHIEDQLRFVYFGTSEYELAGIEIFGDPNREGGAHTTGGRDAAMPAQGATAGGALTDAQILAVVCHERYTVSGADAGGAFLEEFEKWCSEESALFAALESGATLATLNTIDETIMPIGDAPVAGSPSNDQ